MALPRLRTTHYLFLLVLFCVVLGQNGVYAFGAGNIPSFAYMEGRAFRHGDIEDVLEDLIKKGAGTGGFALASLISKGSKFNGLDIKRVYFGNWLRDYSQAVDIAGLKQLQLQTIINLCMVLGFLAHGYATAEFEVTAERLGCYLPTEHIDNPKGYGDGDDPKKYHPGLRGPVDPRELEIDLRTGMKNYIANEQGHWDTSKALVRRTLERCIHLGRQHRQGGKKQDEYEAYRLLGTALHTLEDFPAHTNFVELVLVSMGHSQVFTHVGDQVRIQAPNGKWVSPVITGTFGSDDFFHSLLGEASDHLSQASVTDLNKELDKARSKSAANTRGPGGQQITPADALRELFFSLPGGAGGEMQREMEGIERLRSGTAPNGGPAKRPEEMSPQELHSVLWQVLSFRDGVVKKISKTIEKIPGLGPLIDKLMDSISVFVFTTLEPFLKPLLKTTTSGLQNISGDVIDSHDQYQVFNDPRASDPTHSFLSKDHFNLILNEPAGQIAKVIVIHSVKAVQNAWDNPSVNVHQVTEEILGCLFHPDFHNPNSAVQREMIQCTRDWFNNLKNASSVLHRLSKESVRKHENVRLAGEGGQAEAVGSYAHSQGMQFSQTLAGKIPGLGAAQELFGGAGKTRDGPGGGGGAPPGGPPGGYGGHSHGGHQHSASGGGGGGGYGGGGQAASFYGSGPTTSPPPPPSGGYNPPSHAGYNPGYVSPPPPPGGPHGGHGSFPGGGGGGGAPSFPGPPGGYPDAGPPPAFPGAAPGFPGAPGVGGVGGGGFPDAPGGYGGGGGGPSFPGAGPAFPGAPGGYGGDGGYAPGYGGGPGGYGQQQSGYPGQQHHHQQQGGYGQPQFPNAGPGFPGAPGGW